MSSNYESVLSVNIQLEHDNKILQDKITYHELQALTFDNVIAEKVCLIQELEERCKSLEENIRKHRSNYESAVSKNAQLQHEINLLQSKLNAWYVNAAQSMAKSGSS
ncbi:hypothetical protein DPMN_017895 [Dreissena polymorpha]|uniref:Uncharacterized protein n=1 Tax=Dreissena polymorpha TaxID=45954 RepID=A0A9D4S7T2_DREPO|nr:hypothetical protein DPMN_017895 [Dreissena polymorpha]